MKPLALAIAITLLISCAIIQSKNRAVNTDYFGVWHLNLLCVNSDTNFYRNDIEVGFKSSLQQINGKIDTAKTRKLIEESFEKSRNIHLSIINDTLALITKMKSGRSHIDIGNYDTLNYFVERDVITLDFKSKNNFGQVMKLKKEANVLVFDSNELLEDSLQNPNNHIQIEFIKL